MIRYGLALHIADRDLIGASTPRWWGFAYRHFDIRYTILYPIPLNLIVCYTLKCYWSAYSWLVKGGWEDKLDAAYRQGYNEGNTTREHHYELLANLLTGRDDQER